MWKKEGPKRKGKDKELEKRGMKVGGREKELLFGEIREIGEIFCMLPNLNRTHGYAPAWKGWINMLGLSLYA